MIVRISEACRNEIRSSFIPVRRCRRRPVRLIRSSGHPSTNPCPCSPLTIISEILENSRIREKSLVNRFMIVKFATAAPRTIAVHRFNVSFANSVAVRHTGARVDGWIDACGFAGDLAQSMN